MTALGQTRGASVASRSEGVSLRKKVPYTWYMLGAEVSRQQLWRLDVFRDGRTLLESGRCNDSIESQWGGEAGGGTGME
eukprot:6131305-Pleurochrysis_carterae.AAC.1